MAMYLSDCIDNNEWFEGANVMVQEQVPSSVTTITAGTNLASSLMLDTCPQLTTLVIQDLPSEVAETATLFVPANINARKAAIRTQLAGILQAVEASDIDEELHLIQSLLEPIVQTIHTMKDTIIEDNSLVQTVEASLKDPLIGDGAIVQTIKDPLITDATSLVQTVQSLKDTEDMIAGEVVQPVCKQIRLDDETSQFFTTDAGTSIIDASQLQSTLVDRHNNPILIAYSINQPSQ